MKYGKYVQNELGESRFAFPRPGDRSPKPEGNANLDSPEVLLEVFKVGRGHARSRVIVQCRVVLIVVIVVTDYIVYSCGQ